MQTGRAGTDRPQKSNRRRPVICCTESHLNNFKPIRPGHSTYAKAAQDGRKIFILADSMLQRIRKYEFNRYVQNGSAKFKCYAGDTPIYMHHNVIPHLMTECPDTLVIHGGTNSLRDETRSAQQIANEVLSIGATAVELGVNNVIVSGIVKRKNGMELERKRRQVNELLSKLSLDNNFLYINNDNITLNDICDDRVHLEESGNVKIANNILNTLNR